MPNVVCAELSWAELKKQLVTKTTEKQYIIYTNIQVLCWWIESKCIWCLFTCVFMFFFSLNHTTPHQILAFNLLIVEIGIRTCNRWCRPDVCLFVFRWMSKLLAIYRDKIRHTAKHVSNKCTRLSFSRNNGNVHDRYPIDTQLNWTSSGHYSTVDAITSNVHNTAEHDIARSSNESRSHWCIGEWKMTRFRLHIDVYRSGTYRAVATISPHSHSHSSR